MCDRPLATRYGNLVATQENVTFPSPALSLEQKVTVLPDAFQIPGKPAGDAPIGVPNGESAAAPGKTGPATRARCVIERVHCRSLACPGYDC
jgi:hypothetical protein